MTAPAQNPFAGREALPEGTKMPMVRHLLGHLVIILPTRPTVTEVNKKDATKTQRKMIADVIVCDGPDIMYGGDWDTRAPDTISLQAPCIIPNMWIFGNAVIDFVEASAKDGMPFGRVRMVKSQASGNSYLSMEIAHTDPAAVSLGVARYAQAQAGELFKFVPQPIAAPATQVPQFGAPAAAPQWPAASPGIVAQPMNMAVPAAPAVLNPFAMPPAPPAPVADWTLGAVHPDFLSAGATAQQWAQATQEQRVTFLAQRGITGPGQLIGTM